MKVKQEISSDECSETSENSSDNLPQQNFAFVSLDGNQGGVPTRTTSTLTPTTLRNIEQSLFELTSDTGTQAPYQAGFVPPPAPFNALIDNTSNDNNSFIDGSSESGSQSSWHTPITHEENSIATDNSSLPTSLHGSPGLSGINNGSGAGHQQTSPQNRRNTGGRRPTKPSNLTPEEEEKRRIRRERNKAAAARCRKRRVDQTNDLLEKVEKLEKEKEELQKEIESCTMQQDELKFILQAHRAHCKKHHSDTSSLISGLATLRSSPIDIKPIIIDEYNSKIIKDEPIDSFDSLDGPPSPKRILLANPLIPQSLPNVSTITNVVTPTMLNTPILTKSPPPQNSTTVVQQNALGAIVTASNSDVNSGVTIKSMSNSNIIMTTQPSIATPNTSSATMVTTKPRPNSLNVPLTIPPSQAHLNKIVSDCGVTITTPSNGVFNFESLMDGRTGLTPVSGPLMPNANSRHPLELTMTTPTSEPSKLVSL
ncbi:transcription factor kayak isoform X2 [Condylostylus longicornis]|uniref:transcription factor kayak isoform X2 n=1 Tax=Condylostylus longicornis TaxID=2530218 RepID=UPI00244DC1E6|nr:transcription factor kayak isoform X2 [Condylostylus longicornis]